MQSWKIGILPYIKQGRTIVPSVRARLTRSRALRRFAAGGAADLAGPCGRWISGAVSCFLAKPYSARLTLAVLLWGHGSMFYGGQVTGESLTLNPSIA